MAHHYTVLGLEFGVSEAEVLSAFRKLSLKHHPDKGGDVAHFHALSDAKDACIKHIQSGGVESFSCPSTSAGEDKYDHDLFVVRERERQRMKEELYRYFAAKAEAEAKKESWTSKVKEVLEKRRQKKVGKKVRKAQAKAQKHEDAVLEQAKWYTQMQEQMAQKGVYC